MNKYEEYTDTGFADIGKIPSSWNMGVLKNAFDIVCGATPSEHETNWNGDVPWVGPADMPMFGVISHGQRNLTQIGYNSCGTSMVPTGSIVLSTRAPIGKICLAENELCTNQGCKCLVPKGEFDTAFYAYYLFSILERLQEDGTGTTFRELSTANLKQEPILLLPLVEQVAIAAYLDRKVSHIDSIIAEARASIAEYKQWKASIIYEAVTKGLDKNVEMKNSEYEFIGKIPSHWKTTSLKRLCVLISDGSHFSPDTTDGGMPYVTAGDIHGKGIDYSKCRTISANDFQKLVDAGCQPHKGDVLLVKDGATTGRIGLMVDNKPCVLLSSVAMLTPNSQVESQYLMRLIESEVLQFQIRKSMAGSAMPRTTLTKLSQYIAIDCPIAEQKAIADYLDSKCSSIDSLIAEKESLISDLEAYKKSLIFEVVTGKRKVV